MKGPRYETVVLPRGVLFYWWDVSIGQMWAVFVPNTGRVTQPMAAAVLGVSVDTVIRWCRRGLLGWEKTAGTPTLIPLADVLRRRH